MSRWDIYIADVPFEDLPHSKVRPIIILGEEALVIDCLKMTSHPPRPGEYALKRWKEAGLHKETTVRISKRLSLARSRLKKYVGALHIDDILEIEKRLLS